MNHLAVNLTIDFNCLLFYTFLVEGKIQKAKELLMRIYKGSLFMRTRFEEKDIDQMMKWLPSLLNCVDDYCSLFDIHDDDSIVGFMEKILKS